MIELIQKLFDKGYAYIAEDKSIYFAIDKFAPYGKLANIDRENQRAGVRIKTDEYAKDSVADFALWKAWDDKDGDVVWDSPWGKGRPGWHIECSAMAMKYLGQLSIFTPAVLTICFRTTKTRSPRAKVPMSANMSITGCTVPI